MNALRSGKAAVLKNPQDFGKRMILPLMLRGHLLGIVRPEG
jgi:hypothetical protein